MVFRDRLDYADVDLEPIEVEPEASGGFFDPHGEDVVGRPAVHGVVNRVGLRVLAAIDGPSLVDAHAEVGRGGLGGDRSADATGILNSTVEQFVAVGIREAGSGEAQRELTFTNR